MKLYKGNQPSPGQVIAQSPLGWELWDRLAGADGWVSLKLVAVDPVKHKANYWLAWHLERREFARRRDAQILQTQHPRLYCWVEQVLQKKSAYESTAPVVRELAAALPLDRLYQVRNTGQPVRIVAYNDDGSVHVAPVLTVFPDDLEVLK